MQCVWGENYKLWSKEQKEYIKNKLFEWMEILFIILISN
jgi:hypothetical protein